MKRRYSLSDFYKNTIKAIYQDLGDQTPIDKMLDKNTLEDDLRALRELRYLNLFTDGKKA